MDKKINARKKAQRLARQRKMRNRRIALTICLMIAVSLVSIGGTIAWLTATTSTVTNTFTVGNINIDLYEKNGGTTENRTGEAFDLTPGSSYVKDPKVVVEADSEECYLFVKVETTGDIDYVEYELNTSGWTELTAGSNIYWRKVAASDEAQEWYLLTNKANITGANGSVKISTSLTKEILDSTTDPFEAPSIKFTAYACQTANMTGETEAEKAASAWAILTA